MWWRKKKEEFNPEKFLEVCEEQKPTPFTEEQRQIIVDGEVVQYEDLSL